MTNPADLEYDLEFAAQTARIKVAEEHFYQLNQPFFPLGFSISYRNPGHWDVYAQQCPGKASAWKAAHPGGNTSATDAANERAFRIRGEPDYVSVYDERWNPTISRDRSPLFFSSVAAAVGYIAQELMQEPTPEKTT